MPAHRWTSRTVNRGGGPLYTGCQPRRKPAMCRPHRAPLQHRFRLNFPALRPRVTMDSFEINKILGALLFTCLCLLSLNIAAEALFHPAKPAKPGFEVAVEEKPAAGGPAAATPDEPIEKLLASADVSKGEASAKKCAACHTFGKGEPNRVGPNLYGVVGRERASHAGFNYSAAMKGKPGKWTIE